jgi:hypothetical protein
MPQKGTPEDKRNEALIAAYVEECWGCTLKKQNEYDIVDRAVLDYVDDETATAAWVDATITAWVEIKARKMTSTTYRTIIMSLHKWERGVVRSRITGLPFFFIVGCLEDRPMTVLCHEYDRTLRLRTAWTGRTNRGPYDEDVEACVHIPRAHFYPLVKQQRELL